MSKGLKIYACSGLGSLGIGTAQRDFKYWRDNTSTIRNTRAVNNLLAEINAIAATLQYGEDLSREELLHMLNLIDLYVVCLQAAKTYKNNELQRFGSIIAKYVEDGAFDYGSTDDKERDDHLDTLYLEIETLFLNGENYSIRSAFSDWFAKEVVEENYQGLTEAEQQQAENALKAVSNGAVSGEDADPSDYLHDCGGYYLYQFMSEAKAKKLPYVIYRKWKKQKEVLKYVHGEYDKLMGAEAVDKIIYTGVCEQYKHTPEYVLADLTSTKGVGITAEMLMAIAALISVIVAALVKVLSFVAQVVQAKYAEPSNPNSGVPEDTDWGEKDLPGNKKNKLLKFGAIGLGVMWIISKFK